MFQSTTAVKRKHTPRSKDAAYDAKRLTITLRYCCLEDDCTEAFQLWGECRQHLISEHGVDQTKGKRKESEEKCSKLVADGTVVPTKRDYKPKPTTEDRVARNLKNLKF